MNRLKCVTHFLIGGLMGLLAAAIPTVQGAPRAVFNPGVNGEVDVILVQPDGNTVIGGWFNEVGGASHGRFARLDTDGNVEAGYDPMANARVASGALLPDGKALFGGAFTTVDGLPYAGLVRLNADGSVDTDFIGNALTDMVTIETIAIQPDGRILVGGIFGQQFDPHTGNRNIARLNADGSLDASFGPDAGTDIWGWVLAIGVQADGKILVAGSFASINDQPLAYLARLNSDGSVDPSFNAPTVGGVVYSLLLQADGDLLIGGNFISVNGIEHAGIARLHADGTLDTTFNTQVAGSGTGNVVEGLYEQADGRILLTGAIVSVNGEARHGLARLHSDGSLDTSFVDPQVNGASASGMVIQPQVDDKLLLGGYFTHIGDQERGNFVRLNSDGSLDIDTFTVTPIAGSNGTISPDTPQQVAEADSISFTVSAANGFRIDTVTGCAGMLAGNIYTTGPIAVDCDVNASFTDAAIPVVVTPLAGPHGTLSPDTPQSIPAGQTTTFEVTPDPGYHIDEIGGCDGSLTDSTYTTGALVADCTVSASFVAPAEIVVLSGTPQITAAGTPFPQPLAMRVTGTDGDPVAGVEITFSLPGEGPSAVLSAISVVTDASGEAHVSATANNAGGNYLVAASADGLQVAFDLTNEAPGSGDIELSVTLSTDPFPACGSLTSIETIAGEPINYCFTVTNNTSVTQYSHQITYAPVEAYFMISDGVLTADLVEPIPPGGSFQYNRVLQAGPHVGGGGQSPVFTWTSQASPTALDHSASASVTVAIGRPSLVLTTQTIEASAAVGETVQREVGIANAGDSSLQWRLRDPVPPERPLLNAMFDVPVYGLKEEQQVNNRLHPVTFDATAVQDFAYLARGCGQLCVETFGGDFIDDDFSRLYVLEGYSDLNWNYFGFSTLDTTDGHYANIGLAVPETTFSPPYPKWSGMAWDRTTRKLYGSTTTRVSSQPPYHDCDHPFSEIHTIDPATADTELVAEIRVEATSAPTCIVDLAIAPGTGTMYGVDLNTDDLLVIDKTSGEAVVVGPLGLDLMGSHNAIDFDDATGILYLSLAFSEFYGTQGGIYIVDTSTGLATSLAPWPFADPESAYTSVDSMAIARSTDGITCAQSNHMPWITVASTDGSTAAGSESSVAVELSAADLEPGDYKTSLCVYSNDRARSLLKVPVVFHVGDGSGPGDPIFSDGFEGSTP